MQFGIDEMEIDQFFNEIDRKFAEGRRCARGNIALEYMANVRDMALVQSAENRLLVREILIERADTDPRHLGNAVGGERASPLPLQNDRNGRKHCLHRLPGAVLPGNAAS